MPTNFAEFEAAGGQVPAPSSRPAKAAEASPDEASESAAATDTADSPSSSAPAAAAEPPKGGRFQQRISELTADKKSLQARIAELEAAQAKPAAATPSSGSGAAPAKPAAAAAPAAPGPTPKPKLEDYDTIEAFTEAVLDWRLAEKDRTEAEAKATKQAEEHGKQTREAYGQKLADHLKAHPEYDAEIAKTPCSPLMVQMVLHYGPELGQALIDDKTEAARIAALPRDLTIFEMGKLAARSAKSAQAAAADAGAESDEDETEISQPVKVPARLSASGGGGAVTKPEQAKNFAQFEAIQERLKNKKRN